MMYQLPFDDRFLFDFGLSIGSRVYAACALDEAGNRIVLDMLHCRNHESIPADSKAAMIGRLGCNVLDES